MPVGKGGRRDTFLHCIKEAGGNFQKTHKGGVLPIIQKYSQNICKGSWETGVKSQGRWETYPRPPCPLPELCKLLYKNFLASRL